jgi:hypothetical protein
MIYSMHVRVVMAASGRSTTGLKVRFFSVTIASGKGRSGKLTGKSFSGNLSALKRTTALGNVVMKRPDAAITTRTCME